MSKLSTQASNRVLGLLHEGASKAVAPKLPVVSKVLYESSSEGTQSALDGLLDNQWRFKDIHSAIEDIPANLPITNVLRWSTPTTLVSAQDLHNCYPILRERKYWLPHKGAYGVKFHVVRARNPLTLLPTGAYYLVFPNYNLACVYWLETRGKSLNGLDLDLEFTEMRPHNLKFMLSPWLDPRASPVTGAMASVNKTPLHSLFETSKKKSQLLKRIAENVNKPSYKPADYKGDVEDPLYRPLLDLIDVHSRNSTVLLRNLPFNLRSSALPQLLWDYDFPADVARSSCFKSVVCDPYKQANLMLIRFADADNARRFVRNFHGRRWENLRQSDKAFYEPMLCEVVD